MDQGAPRGGPGAALWTVAAVGAMAAILLVSSIPGDRRIEVGGRVVVVPPTLQNLLHVPVYAVLCALWWRALRGWGLRAALPWAAAIAVTYGILDEVHQAFVPGRYASVADALLNAGGVSLAAALLRRRQRASGPT